MYNIEWKDGATNQLENLDINLSRRIYKKVGELKENPFSRNIKRLKGDNAFRLRIGDYRIIFDN